MRYAKPGCVYVLTAPLSLSTVLLPYVLQHHTSARPSPRVPFPYICMSVYLSVCLSIIAMHAVPVPGLLLLGQCDGGEHRDYRRELLLMRCPSGAVTEWELEIGMQPDPRVAEEVLPGKTNVSVRRW